MITALYIALIVLVNYAFSVLPMVQLPGGAMLPVATFLVGVIFVARDFAQREIGHWVIAAMLFAGALSYYLADPYVAIASVCAFLVSEFADWAVYSFTGKPLHQRILYSSAVGTPLDSAVFLYGIGHFSIVGVLAMTAAKMVAALVVWWMIRKRLATDL